MRTTTIKVIVRLLFCNNRNVCDVRFVVNTRVIICGIKDVYNEREDQKSFS